jgi:thiol-disulfide isomerase/thioredoxin
MRRIVAVGLVAVALAACSGGGDAATPTTNRNDGVDLTDGSHDGQDLSTTVLDGLDGGQVAFADYAGTPVVVNFFASTCAPCVREMPDIESVKDDVGDRVAFVGVATNDRVDDAVALARRTGVTWDLARDPRGDFIAEVGGLVLPTTVLVGADGRVVDVHGGQLDAGELRGMLRDDLGIDA